MAIIFMNLLVGLTVDSIEILKEKSTIIMDVKRIEDIKLGLKFLPRIFRPTKITTMIGKRKTNKLEHVQATKTEPNFSILKIDYIKKVNTPV